MGEVPALPLPFVPARVLCGLQDVTPLKLKPAGRVFGRTERRGGCWRIADRHGYPVPERVKYPVSLVSRVQVVVDEPGDRLPSLGRGVVARRPHGRVTAYEVVEAELARGGAHQQVMVEQRCEGLLRLGECSAAKRRRPLQADIGARVDAEP